LETATEISATNMQLGKLAYALELMTGHEIWVRGRDAGFHVSFRQKAAPLTTTLAKLGLRVGDRATKQEAK
jgi:hypothetical protein